MASASRLILSGDTCGQAGPARKANTCCHKNVEHAALRDPNLVFIIFLYRGRANMFGGQHEMRLFVGYGRRSTDFGGTVRCPSPTAAAGRRLP